MVYVVCGGVRLGDYHGGRERREGKEREGKRRRQRRYMYKIWKEKKTKRERYKLDQPRMGMGLDPPPPQSPMVSGLSTSLFSCPSAHGRSWLGTGMTMLDVVVGGSAAISKWIIDISPSTGVCTNSTEYQRGVSYH